MFVRPRSLGLIPGAMGDVEGSRIFKLDSHFRCNLSGLDQSGESRGGQAAETVIQGKDGTA